jgi:hypothetical protein
MTDPIDVRSIRSSMTNNGYVVFRNAVPLELCEAVLQGIGEELDIWIEDPTSWERVSNEIDQVPIWGHQSQWDIRQLLSLHEIWSAIWGTDDLWADRNSCRFTPPWEPGRAGPMPLHWDVDPHDLALQWFPGILALTDSPPGSGGFRCSPWLMRNRDRWPSSWPSVKSELEHEFPADHVAEGNIIEVPLSVGDLLIFDHHLPHGTVRNGLDHPRAVFYLQMFPVGTPGEAAENIAAHEAGIAPSWWRWKPGHDRVEPAPPAALSAEGKRLLGMVR